MLSEKQIQETLDTEMNHFKMLDTALDSDYTIDSVDYLVTKGWIEALRYALSKDTDTVVMHEGGYTYEAGE
jgi:hypothetical protein